MTNLDLAFHKNWKLRERRSLELRVEAFNVFNHAQFYGAAAVNGNITSSSFGQVVSAATPRLVQVAGPALRLLEPVVIRGHSRCSYKVRRKATRSAFSCAVNPTSEIKLKNSTVSSSVNSRPSCM